jgi:hypothetical protein
MNNNRGLKERLGFIELKKVNAYIRGIWIKELIISPYFWMSIRKPKCVLILG